MQPLVLMLLFNMLRGFVNIPSDGIPYVLFSYSALVPWTFFTNAVAACGPSITTNAEVIKKIALPREVFPLASVTSTLFDSPCRELSLPPCLSGFKVSVGWQLLWLPILIVLMTAISFAVGILLAGLGTFRKDFIFATPVSDQAWLFATPVIYPLSTVPEQWRTYYMLNPLVGVIEGFRNVLLKSAAPPVEALGLSLVVTWLAPRRILADFPKTFRLLRGRSVR